MRPLPSPMCARTCCKTHCSIPRSFTPTSCLTSWPTPISRRVCARPWNGSNPSSLDQRPLVGESTGRSYPVPGGLPRTVAGIRLVHGGRKDALPCCCLHLVQARNTTVDDLFYGLFADSDSAMRPIGSRFRTSAWKRLSGTCAKNGLAMKRRNRTWTRSSWPFSP